MTERRERESRAQATRTKGRETKPRESVSAKPRARSKAPRRRRKGKKSQRAQLWRIGAMLLVAITAGVGLVGVGLWLWGSESDSQSAFVRVEIDEGESLDQIAQRLQRAGLVERTALFTWYKKLYARGATIEPGAHFLERGVSARELVALLARRQSRARVQLTLPEGWDSFQMAKRFEENGVCSGQDFLALVHDEKTAESWVGQPSFEGYLFPSTYELRRNTDARDLVFRMVEEGQRRRAAALGAEDSTRGGWLSNEHELITLASVIQKEAASEAEMPLVASVFQNRLLSSEFKPIRMLQSDPTAGYGCKLPDAPPSCAEYSGKISASLLKDPSNRYNTYRHPGLPPGPIGNPGISALLAARNPAKSPYYFFVLGAGGKHQFSETFAEHRRAIETARE